MTDDERSTFRLEASDKIAPRARQAFIEQLRLRHAQSLTSNGPPFFGWRVPDDALKRFHAALDAAFEALAASAYFDREACAARWSDACVPAARLDGKFQAFLQGITPSPAEGEAPAP